MRLDLLDILCAMQIHINKYKYKFTDFCKYLYITVMVRMEHMERVECLGLCVAADKYHKCNKFSQKYSMTALICLRSLNLLLYMCVHALVYASIYFLYNKIFSVCFPNDLCISQLCLEIEGPKQATRKATRTLGIVAQIRCLNKVLTLNWKCRIYS